MKRLILLFVCRQVSAFALLHTALHAAEPRPAETAAAEKPRLNVVFILADDK